MRVETLTDREELHQFLSSFGETELPDESVAIEAVRDGQGLTGISLCEQVNHVGPFYVRPDCLNTAVGSLLIRAAIKHADGREIHVVAMDRETEKQCERMGMERVEGVLYIRER